MAIFKSPSGVSAIYQATWTDWKGYQSAVEVYGSHGMVRGAYAPMQTMLITMEKPGGKVTKVTNRFPGIQIREKLKSWKTTALNSFAAELAEFVALTEGREGLRIADGHAALRAVEIAAAVPPNRHARAAGEAGRSRSDAVLIAKPLEPAASLAISSAIQRNFFLTGLSGARGSVAFHCGDHR